MDATAPGLQPGRGAGSGEEWEEWRGMERSDEGLRGVKRSDSASGHLCDGGAERGPRVDNVRLKRAVRKLVKNVVDLPR